MKAYLEQLLIPDEEIFLIKRNQQPKFTAMRHYHRELEFKLMISGSGKAFIGEHIYEYGAGDLVLVGPNLPHHWESDNHYDEKGIIADCIYVQFKEDFIGSELYQKSNALQIGKLFQLSRQGIQFSPEIAKKASSKFIDLKNAIGIDRLIGFLEILKLLSDTYEYKLLSNSAFISNSSTAESEKLNKIYVYITKNFKEDISLHVAAQMVHMSKSAFCQYFKKRTLKNFSDFVNDVRIGNATKLIIEKDMGIAEASYESGFKNISYFNRKFKEIHKMTPIAYRKQIKNS